MLRAAQAAKRARTSAASASPPSEDVVDEDDDHDDKTASKPWLGYEIAETPGKIRQTTKATDGSLLVWLPSGKADGKNVKQKINFPKGYVQLRAQERGKPLNEYDRKMLKTCEAMALEAGFDVYTDKWGWASGGHTIGYMAVPKWVRNAATAKHKYFQERASRAKEAKEKERAEARAKRAAR